MNRITIFKILVLIVIAILVFVFIGYVSFVKIKEYRIASAVKNGKIIIDREMHDWGFKVLNYEPLFEPITIELYVRNASQYNVEGALVFFVVLESKGLEEEFIRQMIEAVEEVVGEKMRWEDMKELMEEKGEQINIGRAKAIVSWLERGRNLKKGMDYEPVENGGENYSFTFKKYISLIPGELIKIVQKQPIPPEVRGYLLKVQIEGIIFE